MKARGIWSGVIGGLAGGVAFGMMMAMMGMLPMIGKMVGRPSAFAGFVVHMMISAGIGASFAVPFGRIINAARSGMPIELRPFQNRPPGSSRRNPARAPWPAKGLPFALDACLFTLPEFLAETTNSGGPQASSSQPIPRSR